MVKRAPPMGAANAVATPAAVPMEVKSRWSMSLRKMPPQRRGRFSPSALQPICPMPLPTTPPPCTKGPSLPAMSPAPIENMMPTSLATRVFIFRRLGRWTPLR